jgi:hypothetical protein
MAKSRFTGKSLLTEVLTVARVRYLGAWPVNQAWTVADAGTGLRLRMGRRRRTWIFYNDRRLHGERIITSKTIGYLPAMTLAQARREARRLSGDIAAARTEPGKRKAARLDVALLEYRRHLEAKAARAGKPAAAADRRRVMAGLGGGLEAHRFTSAALVRPGGRAYRLPARRIGPVPLGRSETAGAGAGDRQE